VLPLGELDPLPDAEQARHPRLTALRELERQSPPTLHQNLKSLVERSPTTNVPPDPEQIAT